jgi:hypothetical protein
MRFLSFPRLFTEQKPQRKFGWNEYFDGTPVTTFNYSQYTSRQYSSSSSVYVLSCLFNNCNVPSGDGGALSCSTSVTYLVVEYSSFFSCKTNSGRGGAIFFFNTDNGQCILYSVCGFDCYSANTYGVFACNYVRNIASSKNYVNYTSVARCVVETGGHETLCVMYGEIKYPSINVSQNKCNDYSVMYSYPFADSSSITCSLSYSTFADNIASQSCFYINRDNSKHEIKSCNIIRNTQTSSSSRIFCINGNMNILNSCILENQATNIFYSYSSSSITLTNCTVDKTSNSGYLTIQNTVTKSFIHAFNHMSTQNCNAKYDAVGSLTAVSYVSHTTKTVFYYSCKNYYQSRISDFFSLTWLLVALLDFRYRIF